MKSGMKRLAAVFAAVCALGSAGCGGFVLDGGPGIGGSILQEAELQEKPMPETRSVAAMKAEAEVLFKEAGYEIVGLKTVLPYPHLNDTDLVFDLKKDGVDYYGAVECRVQRACKMEEIVRKKPSSPK